MKQQHNNNDKTKKQPPIVSQSPRTLLHRQKTKHWIPVCTGVTAGAGTGDWGLDSEPLNKTE